MNQPTWKVYVQREGWSNMVSVWLGQETYQGFMNATTDKNGDLVLSKVEEGAIIHPSLLRVPSRIWQEIVDAISEEVPPTKKEAVDANLQATKYHLEDMRTLVFKDKRKEQNK